MNIICCIKNTIKESLIEASVLLKLSNEDVQSAAASSVFIFEANRAFVKVFKGITGFVILLCTFLFHTENVNAMEVKVRYWTTNMEFTEITDSCRVWVISGDSSPITRTELIQVEGSFILNKELTKDLTFEVKDHLDSIHQVRLFHDPRRTSEVYLDIGKSEYTFFPVPQPRPFFLTKDKYFIEIDFRKLKSLYPTTSIEENLDMVTKKLKSVGFNAYGHLKYQDVYQFDTTKNIRSAIEELLNLEYLFIAPLLNDRPKYSYFVNYVDILFDDSLDASMIEDMLNLGGVQSIYPADHSTRKHVVWYKFNIGKAYQVFFKPEAVISLEFLKELEQLAKKEGVLSIRNNVGSPRVED